LSTGIGSRSSAYPANDKTTKLKHQNKERDTGTSHYGKIEKLLLQIKKSYQ
jgi:hypothetical protein